MDTQVLSAIIIDGAGVIGALITSLGASLINTIRTNPSPRQSENLPLDLWGIDSWQPRRSKRKPKISPGILLLVIVIGGSVGGGTGFGVLTANHFCLPVSSTDLAITSPADGSKVPVLVEVRGTSCNIPSDQELWMLVLPAGVTAYYPQPGPVVISSDGQWSIGAAVGQNTPADIGRPYILIAALADQDGSTALQAYLNRGDNSGLKRLPQGVQILRQIQVVRK